MSLLRSIGRALTWPLRRLVRASFADVRQDIGQTRGELQQALEGYAIASTEAMTYMSRELRSLEAEVRALRGERGVAQADGSVLSLEDVDQPLADLLTREASYEGLASDAGLWFNPPVWIQYGPGRVEVGGVSERIAEVPFAFRAFSRAAPPLRVLDVGAAESTFSLSLASLGYEVTAVDMRPIRLRHPRLDVVQARLDEWEAPEHSFGAIACLSAVEHFGLPAYGDEAVSEDADRRAMARMLELLDPDGFLVLTVPFGPARVEPTHRVYDEQGLDRLLQGWQVEEREFVTRVDRRTWVSDEPQESGLGDSAAMLVARPAR